MQRTGLALGQSPIGSGVAPRANRSTSSTRCSFASPAPNTSNQQRKAQQPQVQKAVSVSRDETRTSDPPVIEESEEFRQDAYVPVPIPSPERADLGTQVAAIILAGGPSTNPLAQYTAMPALRLGGTVRLIDVPLSNAIKSGIMKMYVITQFNSLTLNTHIANCYPPSVFGGPSRQGFVDILACSQSPEEKGWYRGSADAVRRNLDVLLEPYRGHDAPDYVLVLSGQALYSMDFGDMINTHRETNAEITIATASVTEEEGTKRGLVRVDEKGVVLSFVEKPDKEKVQEMKDAAQHASPDRPCEASMGIYVFNRDTLVKLLNEVEEGNDPDAHFGYDVIPHALRAGMKVVAHHHLGYWRDVSGVRDFFEVNLSLAGNNSPISMFDVDEGIISRGTQLPPSIITNADITNALVGEGSIVRGSVLKDVVLGQNNFVDNGCHIENSLLLGNEIYMNDRMRDEARKEGKPVMGIGSGTVIRNAIIDHNASVGRRCQLINKNKIEHHEGNVNWCINEGIVVIKRNAVIPDGTII